MAWINNPSGKSKKRYNGHLWEINWWYITTWRDWDVEGRRREQMLRKWKGKGGPSLRWEDCVGRGLAKVGDDRDIRAKTTGNWSRKLCKKGGKNNDDKRPKSTKGLVTIPFPKTGIQNENKNNKIVHNNNVSMHLCIYVTM